MLVFVICLPRKTGKREGVHTAFTLCALDGVRGRGGAFPPEKSEGRYQGYPPTWNVVDGDLVGKRGSSWQTCNMEVEAVGRGGKTRVCFLRDRSRIPTCWIPCKLDIPSDVVNEPPCHRCSAEETARGVGLVDKEKMEFGARGVYGVRHTAAPVLCSFWLCCLCREVANALRMDYLLR